MSALLSVLWPYILMAGAALGVVWGMLASARKAGRDEQKAKEGEARAENLQRIKDAAAARPAGGVSDDPHNLDR